MSDYMRATPVGDAVMIVVASNAPIAQAREVVFLETLDAAALARNTDEKFQEGDDVRVRLALAVLGIVRE